jgi:hypothetical protein
METLPSKSRWIRQCLLWINVAVLLMVVLAWSLSHFVKFTGAFQPWRARYFASVAMGRIGMKYTPDASIAFRPGNVEYYVGWIDPDAASNKWSYLDFGQTRKENQDYRTWFGITVYAPNDGDAGIAIPCSYVCAPLLMWPLLSLRRWTRYRSPVQRGFPVEFK